jgi:hypothetical protein
MGNHSKAWTGLNVLIFGKTPGVPVSIELSLAKATPSNEVKFESFEDYEQAYDFCKEKKNIGFILLLENCGPAGPAAVFKELSSSYEAKGWPCYGILLHESSESFIGLRALRANRNILGYYAVRELTDPSKTFHLLSEIWESFTSAFESYILPESLRETLLSLASSQITNESFIFRDRVKTLLCSNLNVSWIEMTGMRWHNIIENLKKNNPSALTPNRALVQISDICQYAKSDNPIDLLKSKASLPSRVSGLLDYLDDKRLKGELEAALQQISTQAKPGAPALIRHIAAQKEQILTIASEIVADEQTRVAG